MLTIQSLLGQIPSFPEAQGFGRMAQGGQKRQPNCGHQSER